MKSNEYIEEKSEENFVPLSQYFYDKYKENQGLANQKLPMEQNTLLQLLFANILICTSTGLRRSQGKEVENQNGNVLKTGTKNGILFTGAELGFIVTSSTAMKLISDPYSCITPVTDFLSGMKYMFYSLSFRFLSGAAWCGEFVLPKGTGVSITPKLKEGIDIESFIPSEGDEEVDLTIAGEHPEQSPETNE